jgi:hypothetical protein
MCANYAKLIRLVLSTLMLIIIFSGNSFAQCSGGSTTVFSDNFGTDGDGSNCGSTASEADMSSQMGFDNLNGGGCPTPGDGNYSVVCDGASTVGCQWLWHDAFSDQTTGDVNGNMVIINDGANTEFYRKTLTNLCPGKTYTVTFYLANLADADLTSACGGAPLIPNIEASAYAVGGTSGGTTQSYGNLNATSSLTWSLYTFSFNTAAGQTSADIVLKDLAPGGCGNDIAFDGFKITGVINTSPPAPVTFIDFNAGIEGDFVKLAWSTATEVNNDYFLVEKSMDGNHFEPIGNVKGHGTSNQINYYTFEDHFFNSGTVYYRLKQVDFDGKYEYSKTKPVNVESADPVIITNDPSSSQALISFYEKGEATFTIVDMLGRVVYRGERVSDESSISINKSMLCCGFYIVKVQIGSELVSGKIILN